MRYHPTFVLALSSLIAGGCGEAAIDSQPSCDRALEHLRACTLADVTDAVAACTEEQAELLLEMSCADLASLLEDAGKDDGFGCTRFPWLPHCDVPRFDWLPGYREQSFSVTPSRMWADPEGGVFLASANRGELGDGRLLRCEATGVCASYDLPNTHLPDERGIDRPTFEAPRVTALSGADADHVYLATYLTASSPARGVFSGTKIWRFDGSGLTEVHTVLDGSEAFGIWVAAPEDFWVVGRARATSRSWILHFDHGLIVEHDVPPVPIVRSGAASGGPSIVPTPTAIWGSSSHDIWVGTEWNAILHYDGVQWTPEVDCDSGLVAAPCELYFNGIDYGYERFASCDSLVGVGDDLFAVCGTTVLRRSATWERAHVVRPFRQYDDTPQLAAKSADHLLLVGDGHVDFFDGDTWREIGSLLPADTEWRAATVDANGRFWVGGQNDGDRSPNRLAVEQQRMEP